MIVTWLQCVTLSLHYKMSLTEVLIQDDNNMHHLSIIKERGFSSDIFHCHVKVQDTLEKNYMMEHSRYTNKFIMCDSNNIPIGSCIGRHDQWHFRSDHANIGIELYRDGWNSPTLMDVNINGLFLQSDIPKAGLIRSSMSFGHIGKNMIPSHSNFKLLDNRHELVMQSGKLKSSTRKKGQYYIWCEIDPLSAFIIFCVNNING